LIGGYLHYDGVRYCCKKAPNVTKPIEDAEQEVARDQDSIRDRILEMLEARPAGKVDAVVWPGTTQDLPDKEPRFLVGYKEKRDLFCRGLEEGCDF